ncbi:hypothetical protein CASFOL_030796 [Castilleja foliolosa]|uniref:SKP1 component POZ domain-containing protein n=1 Tax=Castilleja foliolosa TaxID=1961234 RepID=A0ABD3C6Y4_9LAMI
MAETKLRIRVEKEEEFVISRSGAALSATINKTLLDNNGAADIITLPNIRSRNFPMIIAYLETHAAVDLSEQEKSNFDSEFASGKDIDFLTELMIDVYNLKIQGLKVVLGPKMADMFKIRSETWDSKYKVLRDDVLAPGWKESFVKNILEMDWAFVDLRRRRKRELKLLELEEEQAKNINIIQ